MKSQLTNIVLVAFLMQPSPLNARSPTPRNTVSLSEFDPKRFALCLDQIKGGQSSSDARTKQNNSDNNVDTCYSDSSSFEEKQLVGGGHTTEVITAIIQYHLPEISTCDAKESAKDPKRPLRGRLVAKIVINFHTGEVENVRAEQIDPTLPKPLVACVVRRIKAWIFPHRALSDRFEVN